MASTLGTKIPQKGALHACQTCQLVDTNHTDQIHLELPQIELPGSQSQKRKIGVRASLHVVLNEKTR